MYRLLGITSLWLAANLAWLHRDRLIRDGDEEGHVGAAELMLEVLHSEGFLHLIMAGLAGDYGEYPPLYPALVAGWWWLTGGGLPGRAAVRAVGLLWPLLTAGAVASMAPAGRRLLPYTLVLLLPGLCGLSRHFMPEGALIAAVSLTAAASWHAARQPSWGRALLVGLTGGFALLIKQTAVLYLLGPALLALWSLRHRSVLSVLTAIVVAGPWYIRQWDAQRAYAARSVDVSHSGWASVAYYPVTGSWSELGPLLTVLALAGLVAGWRQPVVRYGAAWAGLGLLLLLVTPRKYPRLLAPLLPAAALIAGAGIRRETLTWAGAAGAAGWLATLSTTWTLPEPPLTNHVDDGCLQRWLRPPEPDDFGLSVIAEAVRDAEARQVLVLNSPPIPCTIQTTHEWLYHLQPYLRRAGADADVSDTRPAPLTIRWHSDNPQYTVEPLNTGFSIQSP